MLPKRPKGSGRQVGPKKRIADTSQETRPARIEVERSGDWMGAADLKDAAIAALSESNALTLNLNGIDHLDASAMQILLALEAEQVHRGQHLHLENASPRLRQWFDISGAADHFFAERRNENE